MADKICITCGQSKPIDEFHFQAYKNKNGRRTRRNDCIQCHNKKSVEAYHRRTTPEQRKEYMRNYMRKYYKRKSK